MDRIRMLAARGDVGAWERLLNDDPKILDGEMTETLPHVAALAGQTEFAMYLIRQKPAFALARNPEGLIPLHIASARGYVRMVRDLLTLDSTVEQCLCRGQDGRIPLHDAVINGRVCVIEELTYHCPASLDEKTEGGDTVFHLAAKNNQSAALEMVIERTKQHMPENFSILFNALDRGGNKFWDFGQRQTTENNEIAKKGQLQNVLLVVAILIVTVTYQACVTPPTSIWKDGREPDATCNLNGIFDFKASPNPCPVAFACIFLIFNTSAFFSAFILIMLQCLERELILLLVSIIPLLGSYLLFLVILFPYHPFSAPAVLLCVLIVGGSAVLIVKLRFGRS